MTLNSFNYALANPTRYSDPSGLWVLGFCDTGAAGLFAIFGLASGCVTVDQDGEIGATFTLGAGATTGLEFGAGLGFVWSPNATSVTELGGPFGLWGSSVRIGQGVSVDISFGESVVRPGYLIWVYSGSYSLLGGSISPSGTAFLTFHTAYTNTWTADSGWNVNALVQSLSGLIAELQTLTGTGQSALSK
jgi:hypothetical protein